MRPRSTPAAKTTAAQTPARRPPQGFFEILFSGGPIGVVIMLVLIGLSLTAAYLVFEKIAQHPQEGADPARPVGRSSRAGCRRARSTGGSRRSAASKPCFLSFVLTHGLNEAEGGWSEVEKAMEDALGRAGGPALSPDRVPLRARQHRADGRPAGHGHRHAHGVQGSGRHRGKRRRVAACGRYLSGAGDDGRRPDHRHPVAGGLRHLPQPGRSVRRRSRLCRAARPRAARRREPRRPPGPRPAGAAPPRPRRSAAATTLGRGATRDARFPASATVAARSAST